MASVTPVINYASVVQVGPSYKPCSQQRTNQHNHAHRPAQFDPIPMTYTELFPSLIKKNLVQARTPPVVPKEILWWYKHDQIVQASGHDSVDYVDLYVIENTVDNPVLLEQPEKN